MGSSWIFCAGALSTGSGGAGLLAAGSLGGGALLGAFSAPHPASAAARAAAAALLTYRFTSTSSRTSATLPGSFPAAVRQGGTSVTG
jgi:hypothetical protein